MDKTYAVYLLASRRHGTLYTGVTADLLARIHQHRAKTFAGFTADHSVDRLVWYESHTSINAAIAREKAIKKWRREWKISLIETANPQWDDLAVGFGFAPLETAVRPFRSIADRDV